MLRRLLLTSGSLAFDAADSMLLYILAVAILTTVIERETQAQLNPFLGAFAYVCCWQVVLVIIGMFAADAAMTEDTGSTVIGMVMLLSNLAIIAVVFVDTRGDVVRSRRSTIRRRRAVSQPDVSGHAECKTVEGSFVKPGARDAWFANPLHEAGAELEMRELQTAPMVIEAAGVVDGMEVFRNPLHSAKVGELELPEVHTAPAADEAEEQLEEVPLTVEPEEEPVEATLMVAPGEQLAETLEPSEQPDDQLVEVELAEEPDAQPAEIEPTEEVDGHLLGLSELAVEPDVQLAEEAVVEVVQVGDNC